MLLETLSLSHAESRHKLLVGSVSRTLLEIPAIRQSDKQDPIDNTRACPYLLKDKEARPAIILPRYHP